MSQKNDIETYDKLAYNHSTAADGFEKRAYYTGFLGNYRKNNEQKSIHSAVQQFMPESTILDCPCGNGRWFEMLSSRGFKIIGRDTSAAMVDAASQRELNKAQLEVGHGDAENLDLPDQSVDHVFSYALMKHVPPKVGTKIMQEFSRVSKGRIAVSFAVYSPGSWAFEKFRSGDKGFPLWPSEIETMAAAASLKIEASYRVGLPGIGMEQLYVFNKI